MTRQEYIAKRKAAGLCLKCGKPVGREGYFTCAECNRFATFYSAEVRKRRRKDGLCVVCGREMADEGYSTCAECREYNRKIKAKYRKEGTA